MIWKDLLYFSRGEKRALCVLVCLIVAAVVILSWSDSRAPGKEKVAEIEKLYPVAASSFSSSTSLSSPGNNPLSSESAPEKKETGRPPVTEKRVFTYPKTSKYITGTVIELNGADTASLKMIPGIGSVFALRIVKYRNLLRGYASVSQLKDVYGIDSSRYVALIPWFRVDTRYIRKLYVNRLPADSLRRHPYINWKQARVIERLRIQKGRLAGWEELVLLEEFSREDKIRLLPYLSFE